MLQRGRTVLPAKGVVKIFSSFPYSHVRNTNEACVQQTWRTYTCVWKLFNKTSSDGKMTGRKMKWTHSLCCINLGENMWEELSVDYNIRTKFSRRLFTYVVQKAWLTNQNCLMKNLSDHLPSEDIIGKQLHIIALTGIGTCEPSLRAVQGCGTTVVNWLLQTTRCCKVMWFN